MVVSVSASSGQGDHVHVHVNVLPQLRSAICWVILICTRLQSVSANIDQHLHQEPIFVDNEPKAYAMKSCLSPELEAHELSTCRFFALMIDAGSTGTRIHIFEFSHTPDAEGQPFKLESETFDETKPGLSSFESDPKMAAQSVAQLLEVAKRTVPEALWPHTPLALKATAGLRLLPELNAEAILEQIEILFASCPFLTSDDSVIVMTGLDEGIFGWFTLNFLLDRIDSVLLDPQELLKSISENWTAAALDLGGGSTQVTFRPLQSQTHISAPEGFIKQISVFNQQIELYSHSYLGNGLIASRLGILQLSTRPTPKAQAAHELYTACMPHDVQLKWTYNMTDWIVRGTKRYSYDACVHDVRKYVDSCAIDTQTELASRDVYAFSYFYDRGHQAGLVPALRGGITTVKEFHRAAQKACARRKSDFGVEHWQAWQCLDLVYIHTLWTRGYGLSNEKEIHLSKKIRNMETSWALGAAYHLLNTYHETSIARQHLVNAANTSNHTLKHGAVQKLYELVEGILHIFKLIVDKAPIYWLPIILILALVTKRYMHRHRLRFARLHIA